MRATFSRILVEAATADDRVVLLSGDHGYALFDSLRSERPHQFFNAGVAEQNMVGMAAGMAKAGLRPIVYGLSAFVPIRVLEQVKLDICYESLPVVLVGDGAGVVYSALGTSHQSTEDIAALRALPNMAILSPADPAEMEVCMRMALARNGPTYLRMGKADLGEIHASLPELTWGQILPVRRGCGPLGFIATGSMVQTAIKVAEDWRECSVWTAPCIKPLDEDQIRAACRQHDAIIVLEEHSIHGGLGSAVAQIASRYGESRVCCIGIQDRFSQFCGSYDYLMKEHDLDIAGVRKQVSAFVSSLPNRRALAA